MSNQNENIMESTKITHSASNVQSSEELSIDDNNLGCIMEFIDNHNNMKKELHHFIANSYEGFINSMPVDTNYQKVKLLLIFIMVALFRPADIIKGIEVDLCGLKSNKDILQYIIKNVHRVPEQKLKLNTIIHIFFTVRILTNKLPRINLLINFSDSKPKIDNNELSEKDEESKCLDKNVADLVQTVIEYIFLCVNYKESCIKPYTIGMECIISLAKNIGKNSTEENINKAIYKSLVKYKLADYITDGYNKSDEIETEFLEDLVVLLIRNPNFDSNSD